MWEIGVSFPNLGLYGPTSHSPLHTTRKIRAALITRRCQEADFSREWRGFSAKWRGGGVMEGATDGRRPPPAPRGTWPTTDGGAGYFFFFFLEEEEENIFITAS